MALSWHNACQLYASTMICNQIWINHDISTSTHLCLTFDNCSRKYESVLSLRSPLAHFTNFFKRSLIFKKKKKMVTRYICNNKSRWWFTMAFCTCTGAGARCYGDFTIIIMALTTYDADFFFLFFLRAENHQWNWHKVVSVCHVRKVVTDLSVWFPRGWYFLDNKNVSWANLGTVSWCNNSYKSGVKTSLKYSHCQRLYEDGTFVMANHVLYLFCVAR